MRLRDCALRHAALHVRDGRLRRFCKRERGSMAACAAFASVSAVFRCPMAFCDAFASREVLSGLPMASNDGFAKANTARRPPHGILRRFCNGKGPGRFCKPGVGCHFGPSNAAVLCKSGTRCHSKGKTSTGLCKSVATCHRVAATAPPCRTVAGRHRAVATAAFPCKSGVSCHRGLQLRRPSLSRGLRLRFFPAAARHGESSRALPLLAKATRAASRGALRACHRLPLESEEPLRRNALARAMRHGVVCGVEARLRLLASRALALQCRRCL